MLASFPGSAAEALSEKTFRKAGPDTGVVVLHANWKREWGCASYENAQLQELGFTRLPDERSGEEDAFSIVPSSTLFVDDRFVPYLFVIEPGTYAITSSAVKVARSTRDIAHIRADKDRYLEGGKAHGGTFRVNPGEIVYIGHFALDCYDVPMPWRFYLEDPTEFAEYVNELKSEYPFLESKDVVYRLFETEMLGTPYTLSTQRE